MFLTIVTGEAGNYLDIFFVVNFFKIFFVYPRGHTHHTPGNVFMFIRVTGEIPAFLCIIGGLIGLLLVFILTTVLSSFLDFPVFISTKNMILAIGICIIVGILAGFIPASQAARMDPVVAIRSK